MRSHKLLYSNRSVEQQDDNRDGCMERFKSSQARWEVHRYRPTWRGEWMGCVAWLNSKWVIGMVSKLSCLELFILDRATLWESSEQNDWAHRQVVFIYSLEILASTPSFLQPTNTSPDTRSTVRAQITANFQNITKHYHGSCSKVEVCLFHLRRRQVCAGKLWSTLVHEDRMYAENEDGDSQMVIFQGIRKLNIGADEESGICAG